MPILQAWGMTETSPIAAVCVLDVDEDTCRTTSRPSCARWSGASTSASRCAWSTPTPRLRCRGTARAAVSSSAGPGSPRRTTTTSARQRELHRRRLAPHRRRRHGRREGLHPPRRPHQGPHQVGRRVDLSVELENELMAHPEDRRGRRDRRAPPEVVGAAARLRGGGRRRRDHQGRVVEFLADKVAKWQLPDDVVFIDEVPKTSVGKFSKKTLRDRFATYELPVRRSSRSPWATRSCGRTVA
jgi:fatty-acyl-CoA synthase